MKAIHLILLYLFSVLVYAANAQPPSARLEITHAPNDKNPGHFATITLDLNSVGTTPVSVLSRPFYSDFHSEIAGVKFRVDRLSDSCFLPLELTTDIPLDAVDTSKISLIRGKSHKYFYRLEDIYSFRSGTYRVKSFILYFINNKAKELDTAWEYFQIK